MTGAQWAPDTRGCVCVCLYMPVGVRACGCPCLCGCGLSPDLVSRGVDQASGSQPSVAWDCMGHSLAQCSGTQGEERTRAPVPSNPSSPELVGATW